MLLTKCKGTKLVRLLVAVVISVIRKPHTACCLSNHWATKDDNIPLQRGGTRNVITKSRTKSRCASLGNLFDSAPHEVTKSLNTRNLVLKHTALFLLLLLLIAKCCNAVDAAPCIEMNDSR